MLLNQYARGLPLELSTMIIRYYPDDRDYLMKCALVCRLWLMAVRPIIFSTIDFNLDTLPQLDRLRAILRRRKINVKTLTVTGRIGPPSATTPRFSIAKFLDGKTFFKKGFRLVTSLTLHNVILRNVGVLVDIVSGFRHLETLIIRYEFEPTQTIPFREVKPYRSRAPELDKLFPPEFCTPKHLHTLDITARFVDLGLLYPLVRALAPQTKTYRFSSIQEKDVVTVKKFMLLAAQFGPEDRQLVVDYERGEFQETDNLFHFDNDPR